MSCDRCGADNPGHSGFTWHDTKWSLCQGCWDTVADRFRESFDAFGVRALTDDMIDIKLSCEEIQANADERNKLRSLLKKWGQPTTWPDKWKTEDERKKGT